MPEFDHLKSEISDFKSRCESISRQLRAWADSLQNSPIKGQKHLNDRSRNEYEGERRKTEARKQRAAFQRDLEERLKAQAAGRRRSSNRPDTA
jgi:hypothetical protein